VPFKYWHPPPTGTPLKAEVIGPVKKRKGGKIKFSKTWIKVQNKNVPLIEGVPERRGRKTVI
jgi:hypothetical protein